LQLFRHILHPNMITGWVRFRLCKLQQEIFMIPKSASCHD